MYDIMWRKGENIKLNMLVSELVNRNLLIVA